MSEPPEKSTRTASADFDIDFPEEIKSSASEIEITESMLADGGHLMDLRLPEKALAIMVKRGESYFVPTGRTMLHAGDRLMLLSDDQAVLDDTLQRLGIAADEAPDATPKRKWYNVFFDDVD